MYMREESQNTLHLSFKHCISYFIDVLFAFCFAVLKSIDCLTWDEKGNILPPLLWMRAPNQRLIEPQKTKRLALVKMHPWIIRVIYALSFNIFNHKVSIFWIDFQFKGWCSYQVAKLSRLYWLHWDGISFKNISLHYIIRFNVSVLAIIRSSRVFEWLPRKEKEKLVVAWASSVPGNKMIGLTAQQLQRHVTTIHVHYPPAWDFLAAEIFLVQNTNFSLFGTILLKKKIGVFC